MADDLPDTTDPVAVAANAATSEILDAAPAWDPALYERFYEALRQQLALMEARYLARLAALPPAPAPTEEAQVHATTPNGYGVVLVTRKATAAEMLDAVQKMVDWLAANGYQGAEKVVY